MRGKPFKLNNETPFSISLKLSSAQLKFTIDKKIHTAVKFSIKWNKRNIPSLVGL